MVAAAHDAAGACGAACSSSWAVARVVAGVRLRSTTAKELETQRDVFVTAFLDFVHCLDMQVPMLLLGDFNGTANSPRDDQGASVARRLACPLIVPLLGPGGPFVDVQVVLHGEAEPPRTYQNADSSGRSGGVTHRLGAGQPDGNAASAVVGGGLGGAGQWPFPRRGLSGGACGAIDVAAPRPQLPELLQLSLAVLKTSQSWEELLEQRRNSAAVNVLLQGVAALDLEALSAALCDSLQRLVAGWRLAGG